MAITLPGRQGAAREPVSRTPQGKPKKSPQAAAEAAPVPTSPQASPSTQRKALPKWLTSPVALAVLLLASLLLHGLGIAFWTVRGTVADSPEVTLGRFTFAAERGVDSPVQRAQFDLHIALIEELQPAARKLLAERRLRVQQDIEELLRRARGGDFDDPSLRELKRQLQEQVNTTLGLRAVGSVIITDLEVAYAGTAERASERPLHPWREPGD